MDIHAKIKSKYLDKLISGEKIIEYRQIDSFTLRDENGRTEIFEIMNIDTAQTGKGDNEFDEYVIKQLYSDIKFKKKLPIFLFYVKRK